MITDMRISLTESITQALKQIYDPEIPVNIVDLGLIYDLRVNEETGEILVQMTLTSPACPVAEQFPQTVQESVLRVPGVTSVTVDLTWDPPWTKDRMSEVAKLELDMF